MKPAKSCRVMWRSLGAPIAATRDSGDTPRRANAARQAKLRVPSNMADLVAQALALVLEPALEGPAVAFQPLADPCPQGVGCGRIGSRCDGHCLLRSCGGDGESPHVRRMQLLEQLGGTASGLITCSRTIPRAIALVPRAISLVESRNSTPWLAATSAMICETASRKRSRFRRLRRGVPAGQRGRGTRTGAAFTPARRRRARP